MTETIADTAASTGLAIVEKYEAFVHYLYPILQRADRRHHVFRDTMMAALFEPVGMLYHAAKSRQVSRLFAVDAAFATLRAHLRFAARGGIRIVTPKQHRRALAMLAEAGAILGAWIKSLSGSAARNSSGADERPQGRSGK